MLFIIIDLRPSGPAANSSTMGQLRARRKAAKMLVAVVVMFALCYLPVHVLNILRYDIIITYTACGILPPRSSFKMNFNELRSVLPSTDTQSTSARVK